MMGGGRWGEKERNRKEKNEQFTVFRIRVSRWNEDKNVSGNMYHRKISLVECIYGFFILFDKLKCFHVDCVEDEIACPQRLDGDLKSVWKKRI